MRSNGESSAKSEYADPYYVQQWELAWALRERCAVAFTALFAEVVMPIVKGALYSGLSSERAYDALTEGFCFAMYQAGWLPAVDESQRERLIGCMVKRFTRSINFTHRPTDTYKEIAAVSGESQTTVRNLFHGRKISRARGMRVLAANYAIGKRKGSYEWLLSELAEDFQRLNEQARNKTLGV